MQIVCCPEFRGCLLFGSSKCIASTGIAVGTSIVVCYMVGICYWEYLYTAIPGRITGTTHWYNIIHQDRCVNYIKGTAEIFFFEKSLPLQRLALKLSHVIKAEVKSYGQLLEVCPLTRMVLVFSYNLSK